MLKRARRPEAAWGSVFGRRDPLGLRLRAGGFLLPLLLSVASPAWAAAQSGKRKSQKGPPPLEILQRANTLFAQGEYENARKYFLEALPSFPRNFDLLKDLADCYYLSGRAGYTQAAVYYERAFAVNPSSIQVADRLSRCYLALKQYDKAVRIGLKFTQLPNAPAESWRQLAEAYEGLGKLEKAESAYTAYVVRNPGDLLIRSKMAGLLILQKDYNGALEQYRIALSSNPDFIPALVGMARVLSLEGRFDESLELYERVLRREPRNGDAETGKAFVLLWKGREEESLALFQKLHERYPGDSEITRGLAEAQQALDRKAYQAAVESGKTSVMIGYYRDRLSRNPKDLEALKALMALNANPQDCQQSVAYGRQAIALSPNDPDVELNFARSLTLCKDYGEAIHQYRQFLESHPTAEAALYPLGESLLRMHRLPEAEETFRRLLSLSPDNLDARIGLAETLSARGQNDQALAEFKRVLEKSPKNYDALQGEAYLLYHQRNFAQARAIFEQLQAENPSDKQNPEALRKIAAAEAEARWEALRPAADAPPQVWKQFYEKRLASYPNDRNAMKGLAYTEEELNDTAGAIREYQRVLEIYPEDREAKAALGLLQKRLEDQKAQQARELAYEGKSHRAEALALLKDHLQKVPDDTESRVLYGTVLSWDGQYDEARRQLEQVLAKNPYHAEALPALINVEIWSGHPQRAVQLAERGLDHDPRNTMLILDDVHALRNLHQDKEALKVLDRAEAAGAPGNQIRETRWQLAKVSGEYWEFKVGNTYDFFNKTFKGQNEASVSLRGPTPAGSLTFRVNRADRFDLNSYQTEVDLYPSFRPGTYAYLSYGYSPDANLYPRNRFGLELFQDYHGYEFSGGYRFLHFSSDVNIYTFSAAKYHGNWLFTERTFLTPDSLGLSHTEVISARCFFSDEGLHDYLEFFGSFGASLAQARTTLNVETLDSYRFGVTLDKVIGHFSIAVEAAAGKEKTTFESNLQRYTLQGQIYYRF